jgi:hypothetical protein
VRTCTGHDILRALDDLEAGHVGAVMKLEPGMRWPIRACPCLGVVQAGITEEHLAVAVGRGKPGTPTPSTAPGAGFRIAACSAMAARLGRHPARRCCDLLDPGRDPGRRSAAAGRGKARKHA